MNRRTHRIIDTHIATLTRSNLIDLARRLHDAVEREARHPSRPDGYPTRTPGASAPTGPSPSTICSKCNGSGTVAGIEGEAIDCPACDGIGNLAGDDTTVELAAEARHHWHDAHHTLTRNAIRHLTRAATDLAALNNILDQIDRLRTPDHQRPDSNYARCWAMDRIGVYEPVFARPTIDGQPTPLGSWAYKFWRRHSRLPTIAECEQRAAGKRVRIGTQQ